MHPQTPAGLSSPQQAEPSSPALQERGQRACCLPSCQDSPAQTPSPLAGDPASALNFSSLCRLLLLHLCGSLHPGLSRFGGLLSSPCPLLSSPPTPPPPPRRPYLREGSRRTTSAASRLPLQPRPMAFNPATPSPSAPSISRGLAPPLHPRWLSRLSTGTPQSGLGPPRGVELLGRAGTRTWPRPSPS